MVIEQRDALIAVAADWIATTISDAVRERASCALALSGGSTPRPVYERLAAPPLAARIPWESVEIFFGDERAVPPADPGSNYGMARAALLDRVGVPAAQVHRMEADRSDREAAARDYARRLPKRLDLLLLGMGADGHTASLYPRSPRLDERRLVVPATGPTPPRERLTITPPVIAAARQVAVLVAGPDKAATLAQVLRGPFRPRDLPVQLALGGVWFVDKDAASPQAGAAA